MSKTVVVKRRGWKENFDERKVYASVYSACMNVYKNEIKCEKLAEKITKKVKDWLENKNLVNSTDIRKKIRTELQLLDKNIEFYYDKHLPDLSKL